MGSTRLDAATSLAEEGATFLSISACGGHGAAAYHRRRRQASLGRLTPIEFEAIMSTTVVLEA